MASYKDLRITNPLELECFLKLSLHAQNVLKNNFSREEGPGVLSLTEISKLPDKKFLYLRSCGKATLREFRRVFAPLVDQKVAPSRVTMTITLWPHEAQLLRSRALEAGMDASDYVRDLVRGVKHGIE